MSKNNGYDVEQVHAKILNILLEVDRVCKEHHLQYYIVAGTLLGAIRHKGFIPWDDDLDIAMPRQDYDTFMAHAKEFLPTHLEAINGQNDPEYPLSFAKIQDASTTLVERKHLKYKGGIYIDVFPLDGAPAGKLAQIIHFSRFAFYNKTLYFLFRDPYKHGKGMSSWAPRLARFFFTREGVQQKIYRLMTKYEFKKSELICDYDDGIKGILPKAVLGTPTLYDFEGKKVCGIENYDAYLSNKYNDYMQLPPEGHRRQHNFYYLDLNTPYRENKFQ